MKFFDKTITIYCPVTGKVKDISEVNDEMFSTKMMGDGFAVEPQDQRIYSPVKGKVLSVFPSKHAISIQTKGKQDVLIHIGVDTVELNGEGFDIKVDEGDSIDYDTELAVVDFDSIKNSGREIDVMVIFPDSQRKELSIAYGSSVNKKEIGFLK